MQCETIIAGQFSSKVITRVEAAKHDIDIVVFDWRWYDTDVGSPCQLFNQAIVRAVRRGVAVRALVNSDDIANKLRLVGVQCKKYASKALLHTKLMIIDQELVITGSHNYTQSAMTQNYELSVILSDITNISEFRNFFEGLWSSR